MEIHIKFEEQKKNSDEYLTLLHLNDSYIYL